MPNIKQAISKMIFCLGVTQNISTFLRLVRNTKKFKWQEKTGFDLTNEGARDYSLKFKKFKTSVFLRTLSGDIAIFYEIFWKKAYRVSDPASDHTKTIVDLGANIGLASLYFHLQYPNAIIYSLEPEKSNFDLLLKNLQQQISNCLVVPLNEAIDAKDGEACVHSGGMRYNSSLVAANDKDPTVKTISINTLLERYSITRIDILKIDIEGTEQKLFESDTNWLDKIKCLLIEFHSPAIKELCLRVLESKVFAVEPISSENNNLFRAVNTRME